MSRRTARGFTLVELMIVVAIVAVLSSVAILAYRRYVHSAQSAEARAGLSSQDRAFVRGLVLSIRNRDYVDAARVLGASDARILARHVMPNVISIVTVVAGFDIASAILSESALSFLGILGSASGVA